MSIRPIDMNGVTLRTQDVGAIKANEDAKPFAEQLSIENQRNQDEKRAASRVNEQDDTQKQAGRFDAREKGSNEYQDNRKKKDKKEQEKKDMAVSKKTTGGFDIRI